MSFTQILSILWTYRAELWQIVQWLEEGLSWIEIQPKLAQFQKDEDNAKSSKNTGAIEGDFNGTGGPSK